MKSWKVAGMNGTDFSMEENWDVSEDMLPGFKDPKKWESIKETAL